MRRALQDAKQHGRRLWQAGADSYTRPPAVAGGPIVSRTGGLFWITGAGLVIPLSQRPQPEGAHPTAELVMAVVALAVGIGVTILGERLPGWVNHALNLGGTGVLAVLVWLAGGGTVSAAFAVLFVIVPLHSFFFFGWLAAFVYLTWGMAALAVCSALGAISGELAITLAVLDLATAVVVGVLVRAAEAAEVDGPTGRPNHRALQRSLRTAVARADGGGEPAGFGVAVIEVGGVHEVEETAGHAAADRLLASVMRAWEPALSRDALLARYGHDVVGVLLPHQDLAGMRAAVEELACRLPHGQTITAGLARYRPGDSAALVLSRADRATQEARHAGRGRIVVADESHVGVAELRAGLDAGQLQVVYQPIIGLRDRSVVGAEALVRWEHPTRGLVSPADFVPVAEASGLIHQLGEQVLRRTCAEAAGWLAAGAGADFTVTVNVSGQELARPGYREQVVAALADVGLPSTCLVLEVTESSLAADGAAALDCLRGLRALGVGVAVDDFGTGYSSLSRLERLPVDTLKIDRSFVAAIRPDGSAPIVSAIVALASALGLGVVAEGVEDEWQAQTLRTLGCQRGQGWLFGRPGPGSLIADGLARRRSGAVVVP